MSKITQRALANSLKKLMLEKPLSKITVSNVVDDCEVNRRTLYYYFQDIYHLLEWTYKTELSTVLGENKTYDTWHAGFLGVFKYLRQNKIIVLNTYNSLDRNILEDRLSDKIFDILVIIIEELSVNLSVSDDDKVEIANFYKIVFIGVIIDWIKNKMIEDPQNIINTLERIIGGEIHNALIKYEKAGKP